MIAVFRNMIKKSMILLLYPLKIFPIKKNRVILVNNLGYKYACNPKYICEYLLQNHQNQFELIYVVHNEKKYEFLCHKGVMAVKANSVKYFYYAMTAKIFVSNSGMYSYLPLRKAQYVINTWHGGGAYKHIGLDAYPQSKSFLQDIKHKEKKTTIFLSSGTVFSHILNTAMRIPQDKILEIGMPRNDCLCNQNALVKAEIKKKLGISEEAKLVLYAPTYRKQNDNAFLSSISANYAIDVQGVLSALKKRFGGEWVFLFRFHPCIVNPQLNLGDKVKDVTSYEDMQELLVAADILINDYSSSMWDFMLSGKPCLIFAEDMEHYAATAKLYTPIAKWPFPVAQTNGQLEANILNFSYQDYQQKIAAHLKDLGCCETGKATKLVCEKILQLCQK